MLHNQNKDVLKVVHDCHSDLN